MRLLNFFMAMKVSTLGRNALIHSNFYLYFGNCLLLRLAEREKAKEERRSSAREKKMKFIWLVGTNRETYFVYTNKKLNKKCFEVSSLLVHNSFSQVIFSASFAAHQNAQILKMEIWLRRKTYWLWIYHKNRNKCRS